MQDVLQETEVIGPDNLWALRQAVAETEKFTANDNYKFEAILTDIDNSFKQQQQIGQIESTLTEVIAEVFKQKLQSVAMAHSRETLPSVGIGAKIRQKLSDTYV